MDVVQHLVRTANNAANYILTLPSRNMIDDFNSYNARVSTTLVLITLTTVAFISVALYANYLSKDTGTPRGSLHGHGVVKREGDPEHHPPTMITSLRVYPIKSCRGFEVGGTRLKRSGLTLDRNWMFVKPDGKFMTIREDASMTLIDTALSQDPKTKEHNLEISIHGTDARVIVPAFPTRKWLEANTKLRNVEIWGAETDGWEYSPDINEMFQKFFKTECVLVYKGPTARNTGVNGKAELYGKETPHHFADVMSLQIGSEASIKDLNARLKKRHGEAQGDNELSIERFRPNIVVRGRDDYPWEEDTWKRVRITTTLHEEEAIYSIDLDAVARCARCQVPNVDPETGEKDKKEPWDELMKFRRVDDGGPAKWKPCFGMLCIPKNEGKIAVGAELKVLETTDKHVFSTKAFKDL